MASPLGRALSIRRAVRLGDDSTLAVDTGIFCTRVSVTATGPITGFVEDTLGVDVAAAFVTGGIDYGHTPTVETGEYGARITVAASRLFAVAAVCRTFAIDPTRSIHHDGTDAIFAGIDGADVSVTSPSGITG